MNKRWAQVSCEIPSAMVDRLSEFLVELSGSGVTVENLSVDTFSLDTVADSPVKTVTAYFPAEPGLEGYVKQIATFLADTGPDFTGFVFHEPGVSFIKEEDWANNWKEHFKPSRIGTRLVIKPTWEGFAGKEGDIIIELDPGMAFGTGTHPTTRLCLEAMERIFAGDLPFDSEVKDSPSEVLDVGTGSGVLAIAAAKLGARRVVGLDIDPDAVTVAEQNLALNRISGTVTVGVEPLAAISGLYDIVLANILAEELVRLRAELFGRVGTNGYLVLSGILTEKEELVCQGFAPLPLSLVEITRQDEWSCIIYRRES